MNDKVSEIKMGLQHFHGTEMFYSIPLIGTRYTDGIKYLANEAECYWLITDASVIAKSLMDKSEFMTIDFMRLSDAEKKENRCEAQIIYGDGNGIELERHGYNITDFPLNYLRLYFVDNTLMLPTEY